MIATDLNYEKLKELKQENDTVVLDTLDVTKGDEVKEVMGKYNDMNVLFNCAG